MECLCQLLESGQQAVCVALKEQEDTQFPQRMAVTSTSSHQ